MKRVYKVGDKEVEVEINVIKDKPSMFLITVKGDISLYIANDDELQFGVYVDDVLSALKEALDEISRD